MHLFYNQKNPVAEGAPGDQVPAPALSMSREHFACEASPWPPPPPTPLHLLAGSMSTGFERIGEGDGSGSREEKDRGGQEVRGRGLASPHATGSAALPAEPEEHAKIRALRERCAELQWRVESSALRSENEALESQVLQMQEVFLALQEDFREMKDRFGVRLEELHKALEDQQGITTAAEKRVVCSEDLVRFHEEQRRLMAGHWKSLCQTKDERLRHLNLQLTEYTIDWQQVGVQKQTEASLSHELQCLQDRHGELISCRPCRRERTQEHEARLSEVRAEVFQLREAESEAKAAAQCRQAEQAQVPCPMELHEAEATCSELRGQLQLLTEWEKQREDDSPRSVETFQTSADFNGPRSGVPSWPHTCIWRDELDVRERQLEKITAQLDRTNNALLAAQAALATQRARHEEMKTKHRVAEANWREGERRRNHWQREYLNLQRAESALRKCSKVDLRQDLAAEFLTRSNAVIQNLEQVDSKSAESEAVEFSERAMSERGEGSGAAAAAADHGPFSTLGSGTGEATLPAGRHS